MGKIRALCATLMVLVLYAVPAVAQTCAPTETRGALSSDGKIRVLTVTGSSGSGTDAASLNKRVADLKAQGWEPIGNPANNSAQMWCAVSATTPPPLPPPPPPPPALSLTCPATQTVPATESTGAIATFAAPTSSGGVAPVTVTTAPQSGSRFAVGTTTVTGTASDSVSQTASCSFTVTVSPLPAPPPPPPPPPTSGSLQDSGFETATGCTDAAFADGGRWSEPGGSSRCAGSDPHEADVVSDVKADGNNSLRVTQKPGRVNGTDVRITKRFAGQPSLTITQKLFYAPNFRWAGADYKINIAGQYPAQTIYTNFRGGFDEKHGRICIHVITADSVHCDGTRERQLTVGRWYRVATYIVSGSQGRVEVYLKDCGANGSDASCAQASWTKLTLAQDAGRAANINALNTGPAVDYFKLDTTYNAGSFITENMAMYYDTVKAFSGLVLP